MSNRVALKTTVALLLGLLAAVPAATRATAGQSPYRFIVSDSPAATQSLMTLRPTPAGLQGEPASDGARLMAGWVLDTADNTGLPFVIVDKKDAKAFVFDGKGQLIGAAPVLLGLARGDDSVPGIGERKLADIRPEERTTAAGRFVADLGRNLGNQDVLWIDYGAALALHRVLAGQSRERRMQQTTASPRDKRITFGCIEVPAKFFDHVVLPAFTGTSGVIYILPEVKSIPEVFFSADRVGAVETQSLAPTLSNERGTF